MAQNYPQTTQKWCPYLRTISAKKFDWKGGFANFFAFRMYGSDGKIIKRSDTTKLPLSAWWWIDQSLKHHKRSVRLDNSFSITYWSVAMVALLTVLLCCTIVSITYWSVAMVATYIGCVVVLCCNVLCFVLFCWVGQYILVSGNCCHIGEQL